MSEIEYTLITPNSVVTFFEVLLVYIIMWNILFGGYVYGVYYKTHYYVELSSISTYYVEFKSIYSSRPIM